MCTCIHEVLLNYMYLQCFYCPDRFMKDDRNLPVLWHQCLLVFVQRYKEDMSSEQKESLFELMRKHSHDKITPDIRRELSHSKCRDVELAEPPNAHLMMQ